MKVKHNNLSSKTDSNNTATRIREQRGSKRHWFLVCQHVLTRARICAHFSLNCSFSWLELFQLDNFFFCESNLNFSSNQVTVVNGHWGMGSEEWAGKQKRNWWCNDRQAWFPPDWNRGELPAFPFCFPSYARSYHLAMLPVSYMTRFYLHTLFLL